MNLERQLQEHFSRSDAQLTEPQERLDEVVTRGRRRRVVQGGLMLAAVGALAFAVPTLLSPLDRTQVEFEAPATQPAEEPTTSQDPTDTAEAESALVPRVSISDLGSPVLEFSANRVEAPHVDQPFVFESDDRIENALPDGTGGFVVQVGKTLHWFSDVGQHAKSSELPIGNVDGLHLRSVLRGDLARANFGVPTPRVLYSVTVGAGEEAKARFFAIELSEGAQPEFLESASAHESGVEGPTHGAADAFIHGACHLMCTLHVGLANEDRGVEPLYHGGGGAQGPTASINGLTSTPDGRTIAFVESSPAHAPSKKHPQVLVLLDGASFKARARIELPAVGTSRDNWGPTPHVSISADGQRVLVSVVRTFLIEEAASDQPVVRQVETDQVLRWMDPEAANQ